MTCDLCDEKASVFLTQIVDGQMEKVNLCESCAKAKGVTDPTGFALADLLLGLGDEADEPKSPSSSSQMDPELPTPEKSAPSADEKLACSACGYTHAQFKKAGRLGCPKCYQVFGAGLESLLKAMHKGTKHIGKFPVRHRAVQDRHETLAALRSELDDAIGREAFEDAARLRDEIATLEAELAKPSEPTSESSTETVGS